MTSSDHEVHVDVLRGRLPSVPTSIFLNKVKEPETVRYPPCSAAENVWISYSLSPVTLFVTHSRMIAKSSVAIDS